MVMLKAPRLPLVRRIETAAVSVQVRLHVACALVQMPRDLPTPPMGRWRKAPASCSPLPMMQCGFPAAHSCSGWLPARRGDSSLFLPVSPVPSERQSVRASERHREYIYISCIYLFHTCSSFLWLWGWLRFFPSSVTKQQHDKK